MPPWTLFWELSFSLLTIDFATGNDNSLGICLCPGMRVVTAWTFATLLCISPLQPSLFLFSFSCSFFFFLLVGAFCFYLLILFVAKQAEGGPPLCDLLLALHLPPLLCPSPPRERERERNADLTTAVTTAAAAATAATLVMSMCPQIQRRAQALLVKGKPCK